MNGSGHAVRRISLKVLGLVVGGALLVTVGLARCVPASPGDAKYKEKASTTIEGALGDVATVQQILQTLQEDQMFRPAAITQVRSSQDSLDSGASGFSALNPPPDLDWLDSRTNDLLSEAQDTTDQARIAIERRQVDQYPALAQELGTLADQLDQLDQSVS